MTVGNPYKVTKKVRLHTNPTYEGEIIKTGVFKRETKASYIFNEFRVRKATVTEIQEVGKWDTETLREFAERIKKHYPHTISIQNTIDKELAKMIAEVKQNETDNH